MILNIGINDLKGWSNWEKLGKDHIKYRTYLVWKGMIGRCYSEYYHKTHPTYIGCTVCKQWHTFSNFAADVVNLKGYKEWCENKVKYVLDKDVIILGNTEYSPESCSFITIVESNREVIGRRGLKGLKEATKRSVELFSKKVKCIYPSGEEEIFSSTMEAQRMRGFDNRCISKCARGLLKSHHKCKFIYI